ncbi:hypothetical protein, partial [Hyphomonas sp.]|uniref:hypothetical protein n=1 Tax=Hyphomonas sp. TaxID=87 RepID=UPI003265AFD6
MTVERGPGLVQTVFEMAIEPGAKASMLLYEIGKFAHSVETGPFRNPASLEPLMMSGNRSALPPTRPLRTVLASFPAHGSSKSLLCRAAAVGVDKSQVP